MDLIKNLTVDLSENDVKEIIAKHISEHLECCNLTADDVALYVGKRCVGVGPMEYEECYFKKATVRCKDVRWRSEGE